jgi:hypothetical protein
MSEMDRYDRAVAQWLLERLGDRAKAFSPDDAVYVRFEGEETGSGCPTCGSDYEFGIEYSFRRNGERPLQGLYDMESYPTGRFVAEVSALVA